MSKINFKDFDVERVTVEKVETKPVPGNKGVYSFMKLKYNVGTLEAPIKRPFVMEYPRCTSNRGIEMRVDEKSGNVSFSIQARPDDPTEAEELYEKMQLLKKKIAQFLYENRVEMEHIRPTTSLEFILEDLNNIMYVPTDRMGIRISGGTPSMYLKLDDGHFDLKYKSQFLIVVGKNPKTGKPITKPLDWEDLKDMRVSYTPLTNFFRVFSGQAFRSVQSKMRSCTVHELTEPEISNPQEELAMELASNPDYMAQIEAGLKLARERATARAAEQKESGGSYENFGSASAPPTDPLEISSIVAAATAGMGSVGNTSPTETGTGTETESASEGGSGTVTSSFNDYMKSGSKTKGPLLTKIPSLPSVPSMTSVATES